MSEPHYVTTFSMIAVGVIEGWLERDQIKLDSLFEKTTIAPATWARIRKGHSKLDLEQLYSVEQAFSYPMNSIIATAKTVEAKVKADRIDIIPPFPTQGGRLTKKDGVAILTIAVIAFLAIQASKK